MGGGHLTQSQMIILHSFSENKNQPEEESCVGQFPRRSVCQDRGGAEKRSERPEAQEQRSGRRKRRPYPTGSYFLIQPLLCTIFFWKH